MGEAFFAGAGDALGKMGGAVADGAPATFMNYLAGADKLNSILSPTPQQGLLGGKAGDMSDLINSQNKVTLMKQYMDQQKTGQMKPITAPTSGMQPQQAGQYNFNYNPYQQQ